jgi:hypothetical protein
MVHLHHALRNGRLRSREVVLRMRDPRKDPRPGDILRPNVRRSSHFDSRDRTVSDVDNGRVYYVGTWCCEPNVSLASWRKWAKTAEVIKTA